MGGYRTLKERLANERSRAREALFFHKICYDLKVAGILVGTHLQIYKVEVDDSGVDVIVEWELGFRKFQLKTIAVESSTSKWQVNASLLKPTALEDGRHQIPEWQYYHPFGVNGGVLLAEVDWGSDVPKLRYYFTDLFILMLLRDSILRFKPCAEAARALSISAVSEFSSNTKVELTRRCFVRASSVVGLLELMGLPSRAEISWRNLFYRVYCRSTQAQAGPPPEVAKRLLQEHFSRLTAPAPKVHIWTV